MVIRSPIRSAIRGPLRGALESRFGGVVYDYYVNPTTGNDSNDGSLAAPFETITAALAVAASGETIGVLAGSTALEADTLDFDTLTVGVYGGSDPALIDVRYHPSSPSWSLVSGASNTYEATITHREAVVPGGVAETGWLFGCWVDLTSLTWVAGGADIAANTTTVDGQAGSFTVYKSGSTVQDPRLDTAGTDYVYRVHLPDSTSPSGKDISIADRPAVFAAQDSAFYDLEFIGNAGKDMSGDNNLGTGNTFVRVLFRDASVHAWAGSPVTATNWGGTRRVIPGLTSASADRAGNLINLYDGDNSDKARDTSLTFKNVGDGWRKLVYAHTAGGQTDRIGNNLTANFQSEEIDNIENVIYTINSTNKLFSQIDVSNFVVTNADGNAFEPGTVLNARGFNWKSANPKTANVQFVSIYDDTLLEDGEWEFLEPFNATRRNWLYAAVVSGKTLTIRRCIDRAWNTTRRAYMRRGSGFENANLVIEDSTLGNLMDQAAGTNWPASVTASNSTLGFGDRAQGEVEAGLLIAGVDYDFTNCVFVNTSGVQTSEYSSEILLSGPDAVLFADGDQPYALTGAELLEFSDAGSGDSSYQLVMAVGSSGTITLAQTTGLTGSGDGTNVVNYSGTRTNILAAIDGAQIDGLTGETATVLFNIKGATTGRTASKTISVTSQPNPSNILMETGDILLMETGDAILLEA